MRVWGAILLSVGFVIGCIAWVGVMRVQGRMVEVLPGPGEQPAPREMARKMVSFWQEVMPYYALGVLGFVFIIAGLPLLIVGIVLACTKKYPDAPRPGAAFPPRPLPPG